MTPEDSVEAAAPEVPLAGVFVPEARLSTLIILLTSASFILIISNHNSCLSIIEFELLFASLIARERRSSFSLGISKPEILFIISKYRWHKVDLSLVASLIIDDRRSVRANSCVLFITG